MDRMRIVQLNEPITTEGVRVTFLDPNHCPGAAMILFEVPGRRPVLHSGDCRCGWDLKRMHCTQQRSVDEKMSCSMTKPLC